MKRAMARFPSAFTVVVLYGAGVGCGTSTSEGSTVPNTTETLTFNKDIAPIVFENCSVCHRPEGGAPFDLLTFDDVRTRSRQISVVTEDRYMPPWMPTQGHGEFAGERTLSENEIEMFEQWSREGCKEGSAGDLPPVPTWPEDWALGPPDLVLELPEDYELPADGPDVYRNFVLSVPLEEPVYVRAFEFDPSNPRVVHHSFVLLDPTRTSRQLDEESPEPGFGNLTDMELPNTIESPGDGGFFQGWNPGKRVFAGYDDMSWPLDSTYDVVLQLHMRPSGKIERVRPSVAFYFAEKPPTRFPLVIGLRKAFLNIPAGEKNYSFERQYTLPVDVDVLAVLPHAHYIGKKLQGFAELPDGTKEWLIDIEDWDFNWQGDYRYVNPLFLPKGTRIIQRYTYDNSSSNPRNPVSPPRLVRSGGSTLDEMGEFWLQLLPRRAEERDELERHYNRFFADMETRESELEFTRIVSDMEREALQALEQDPEDWSALLDMAKCRGRQNRIDEAIKYARRSVAAAPNEAEPHCMLGHLLLGRDGKSKRALNHFTRAIAIRPDFVKAHVGIGLAWNRLGDPGQAERALTTAHDLAPEDPFPLYYLGVLAAGQGRVSMAVDLFQKTLNVDPMFKQASDALAQIAARRPGVLTK